MNETVTIFSGIYESTYKQEQTRIEEFVDSVKAGVAGYFFLTLFAPPGYGKTMLLKQVWNAYERTLPASLVQMKSFREQNSGTFALRDLLVHIIRDLRDRLPRRVITLLSDYEQMTNEKQLAEIIVDLVSGAKEYEKATLLLLDDYDAIPEEQRDWLEKNVFSEIVREGKPAVILTSEREVRFRETLDLRMRVECRELDELSVEAISHALPEYQGIAGEIHRITGGLPVFTEQFVEQLKAAHIVAPDDFRTREQELVRKYHQAYIKDKILAEFEPDIRETLLALALLRRFDVKVLGKILPVVLPDLYKDYKTINYLNLVDRLRSWVQWRMQGGYALDDALRVTLQGYVRIEKPDLYEKMNRAAVALYRDLLQQEYREYYLVELLYHRLCVFQFEKGYGLSFVQDQMSQAKVGDELLANLNGEITGRIHIPDLDSLRNSLQRDPDLKDYAQDAVRAIENLMNQRMSKEAD